MALINLRLQYLTYNPVSATVVITPVLRGAWTPVSSSVTFTSAGKASRGGAGHFDDLNYRKAIGGGGQIGILAFATIDKTATVYSRTSLVRKFVLLGSHAAGNLEPSLRGTWAPVSSSVTFTSAGKASRGGAGHFDDLNYRKAISGNQYGSFGYSDTILSSTELINTTQARSHTGVSRITAASPQNQSGISSVRNTTTQTQTGVSKITDTAQQDQLGVSNIYGTTSRTQTGVTRITQRVPNDQTGISRITVRNLPTQLGVSNIYATTLKTQLGRAAIRNTTTKTQSGVAKITNITLQTEQGVSRITARVTVTEGGVSRITATTTQTQAGISAIQRKTEQVQTGDSRIQVQQTADQLGVSRIKTIKERDQMGTSSIRNTRTITQFGKTRIADPQYLFAPLFDSRFIEDPADSYPGTMTFLSGDAQFEDWIVGYRHHQFAYGPPLTERYPAPHKKQSQVAFDFQEINLFVEATMEEDVTPEDVTIDGNEAHTSDWISGVFQNQTATISNKTNTLVTQNSGEVLRDGQDPPAFNTQIAGEVLMQPASNVQFTQDAVEVLHQINVGWIQQEATEALANQISSLRYAVIQQCAVEALQSIKARVRETQLALEALKTSDDPPVNQTQVAAEVLRQQVELDVTPSFVQQVAIEAMKDSDIIPANFNHVSLEMIFTVTPAARVNHMAQEICRNATLIPAWINHHSLELIRNAAVTPAQINHMAIEMLVRPEYDPTVSSLVNNPKHYF